MPQKLSKTTNSDRKLHTTLFRKKSSIQISFPGTDTQPQHSGKALVRGGCVISWERKFENRIFFLNNDVL